MHTVPWRSLPSVESAAEYTRGVQKESAVKRIAVVALLLAAGAGLTARQQNVPFQNGIPVAPTGLAGKPLPKMPVEYDTGEGMRIKVSTVATGLGYPFS